MVGNDPFYNRKPVPDEFLEHVGPTGMTKQEEYLSRERKLSSQEGDLRRFSNPKTKSGQLDPHYARKQVPDNMIHGVGESGLSAEEEYYNREKKMIRDGVDLRKFSTSAQGGMEPQNDPYYGRKQVAGAQISGVGESGMSRAEEFETRENKASLFDLSKDPFEQLAGSGHRASISGVASAGAADARRRSSAVGPDAARATANVHGHGSHSGYSGGSSLPPINSGNTLDDSTGNYGTTGAHTGVTGTTGTTGTHGITGSHAGASGTHTGVSGTQTGLGGTHTGVSDTHTGLGGAHSGTHTGATGTHVGTSGTGHGLTGDNHGTSTTTTTTTTTNTTAGGAGQHGLYHDLTTNDPDSVAPHEMR